MFHSLELIISIDFFDEEQSSKRRLHQFNEVSLAGKEHGVAREAYPECSAHS